MQGIKINGCDTRSYYRLSTKCRKCDYKNLCKNKTIVTEAYNIPPDEQLQLIIPNRGITANEAAEALKKATEKLFQSN